MTPYESGKLGNAFCFHTAGQGDVGLFWPGEQQERTQESQNLGHVVSRCSRKGRNMWGLSPLITLLLFSIFTAVHSEEKQDVGKGA